MRELARQAFDPFRRPGPRYSRSELLRLDLYDPYLRNRVDPPAGDDLDSYLAPFFGHHELLGPYEKFLLSRLCPGRTQQPQIVVGGAGSGKTATMSFLRDFIHENWLAPAGTVQPLILYTDCNDIQPVDHLPFDEALAIIVSELATRLRTLLLADYWDEVQTLLATNVPGWAKHQHETLRGLLRALAADEQRASVLPGHSAQHAFWSNRIECEERIIAYAGDLAPVSQLSLALSLIGEIWQNNQARVVFVCLDNLDPLELVMQREVSRILQTAVYRYELPIVLPLRLITYSASDIRAADPVSIPQSGITPLQEVRNRTRNLLAAGQTRPDYWSHAKPIHQAGFLLRAGELFQMFETDSEFKGLFKAIAGRCVRRGLACVRRLFEEDSHVRDLSKLMGNEKSQEVLTLTTNLDFESSSFADIMKRLGAIAADCYRVARIPVPRPYHYVQLLLSQAARDISGEGALLENVFGLPRERSVSTLKYRMLEWIHHRMQHNPPEMRLRDLVARARHMGFKGEDIRDAVNSLHKANRRLIWTTGPQEFANFRMLEDRGSEEVGITASGLLYLTTCVRSLDYVAAMLAVEGNDRVALADRRTEKRLSAMALIFLRELGREVGYYEAASRGRRNVWSEALRESSDRFALLRVVGPLLVNVSDKVWAHLRKVRDLTDELGTTLEEVQRQQRDLLARYEQYGLEAEDVMKVRWPEREKR